MEQEIPLTKAQQTYLKLHAMFPEDPDGIRAKREEIKKMDDQRRQLLLKRRKDTQTQLETLAKARAARQVKPKT